MHLDKQIAWKSVKFHFLSMILKYCKRISSYKNVIVKSEQTGISIDIDLSS